MASKKRRAELRRLRICPRAMLQSKSKSKENFQERKHTYCTHTETKLTLLFNVIPLNFNAPVPEFHFLPSEKKKFFFVASLTNFASRQFLDRGLQFHS